MLHHAVQGGRAGHAVFVEKQDATQAFELCPGLLSTGPFSGGLELAFRKVGASLVHLFTRMGQVGIHQATDGLVVDRVQRQDTAGISGRLFIGATGHRRFQRLTEHIHVIGPACQRLFQYTAGLFQIRLAAVMSDHEQVCRLVVRVEVQALFEPV